MPAPNTSAVITRREALRRTILFSTAALTAGHRGILRASSPETKFESHGLHLLALGDYGTRGNERQVAVANSMATFAKSLGQPLTAVLALGDNFYKKITPDRFENHFEKIYSPEHLNCPFYVCAGNHDYGTAGYDFQKGKLRMQLDYAKRHPQSRWKFPAKWYTVELPNADNPLVKIIVLDGNYWSGALTPKEKIEQRHFLKTELKAPTKAPWVWAVNHFPMFSECKARGDEKSLITEWGTHMQKHPVSLFISGHDHSMQHLQVEGYATNFIVSGAGGANLYDVKRSKRGFIDNRNLGFNHIYVTPDELHVQFISATGVCLHHFQRDLSGRIKVLA
jgi:tartrate-resistant acid phosphatase type 5